MNTPRPRSRYRVMVDAPEAFVVDTSSPSFGSAPRPVAQTETATTRAPAAQAVTHRARQRRHSLRRMLATQEARRQAFLLRELISPPVALRDQLGDRPD